MVERVVAGQVQYGSNWTLQGPPDLPPQHRQLVAQDEYLGVLREGIPPVGPEEPEQATEELVEEREGYGRAAWPSASELVKSDMRVIGPFRFPDPSRRQVQPGGKRVETCLSLRHKLTLSPGSRHHPPRAQAPVPGLRGPQARGPVEHRVGGRKRTTVVAAACHPVSWARVARRPTRPVHLRCSAGHNRAEPRNI
jgi:hypothetical protein